MGAFYGRLLKGIRLSGYQEVSIRMSGYQFKSGGFHFFLMLWYPGVLPTDILIA